MSRGIVASQRVPGRDSRSVLLIGGLQVYAHITVEKSPELWVKDLTRLGKISIPETEGLWEIMIYSGGWQFWVKIFQKSENFKIFFQF